MNVDHGTVAVWIGDRNPEWWTDGRGYQFAGVKDNGIAVEFAKHAAGVLEASIAGPFGRTFTFKAASPRPVASQDGHFVHVSLRWTNGSMKFFLNGAPVAEACVS